MRAFVAVYPDEAARAELADVAPEDADDVRVTDMAEWHVTLRFLGQVDVDHLDVVAATAGSALKAVGPCTITLGPLTNVALALQRWPALAQSIRRCVVMGGAPCCEGNVTPAAEFNIWVDPEAARIVFASGAPIEMIGWHLSRFDAVLNENDIQQVLRLGTPFSDFAIRANSIAAVGYRKQTGEAGISLPDPVAMAIFLDPALKLEVSRHHVAIECDSDLTRGMTVVDRLGVAADPRNLPTWTEWIQSDHTIEICWRLDVPRWKAALFNALKP